MQWTKSIPMTSDYVVHSVSEHILLNQQLRDVFVLDLCIECAVKFSHSYTRMYRLNTHGKIAVS
jgi:hypothetical protein